MIIDLGRPCIDCGRQVLDPTLAPTVDDHFIDLYFTAERALERDSSSWAPVFVRLVDLHAALVAAGLAEPLHPLLSAMPPRTP